MTLSALIAAVFLLAQAESPRPAGNATHGTRVRGAAATRTGNPDAVAPPKSGPAAAKTASGNKPKGGDAASELLTK